jgi:hypothetical protein
MQVQIYNSIAVLWVQFLYFFNNKKVKIFEFRNWKCIHITELNINFCFS